MNSTWRRIPWLQLGAAIDMLDNALRACPVIAGSLPEKPYTKDELQAYFEHCRQKCQATVEALTDEKANQRCTFPWDEEVRFAELQLYSMRHVQERTAHLSMLLGQKVGSAPDWLPRAENRVA